MEYWIWGRAAGIFVYIVDSGIEVLLRRKSRGEKVLSDEEIFFCCCVFIWCGIELHSD